MRIDKSGANRQALGASWKRSERTEKTEDVVRKGDQVRVKLLEIDDRGKMRLSRKALLEKEKEKPVKSAR